MEHRRRIAEDMIIKWKRQEKCDEKHIVNSDAKRNKYDDGGNNNNNVLFTHILLEILRHVNHKCECVSSSGSGSYSRNIKIQIRRRRRRRRNIPDLEMEYCYYV